MLDGFFIVFQFSVELFHLFLEVKDLQDGHCVDFNLIYFLQLSPGLVQMNHLLLVCFETKFLSVDIDQWRDLDGQLLLEKVLEIWL